MTREHPDTATKKLVLKFVLDNIEYRKRCLYLQEIIAMGKTNDIWIKALNAFFDTPVNSQLFRRLSKN